MSKNGFDYSEFEKLKRQIEATDKELSVFIESCAKELAARLLAKVVKRTPVGDYTKEITITAKKDSKNHNKGDTYTKKVADGSGKTGGTLRRGWTGGEKRDVDGFVHYTKVHHFGDTYVIIVENPIDYASYVEFGHRTKGGKGWVKGQFMLTLSEKEIQSIAPALLEKKIKRKLGECFG